MITGFNGITPQIPSSTYVANSADVIGNVVLGNDVSIWNTLSFVEILILSLLKTLQIFKIIVYYMLIPMNLFILVLIQPLVTVVLSTDVQLEILV